MTSCDWKNKRAVGKTFRERLQALSRLRTAPFSWSASGRCRLPAGMLQACIASTFRFEDLTLDASTQRGFYFDFDAARKALQQREQASSQELRERFEQLFGSRAIYGDEGRANWVDLKRRFARAGVPFVHYPGDLPFELRCIGELHSAASRRPEGVSIPTRSTRAPGVHRLGGNANARRIRQADAQIQLRGVEIGRAHV